MKYTTYMKRMHITIKHQLVAVMFIVIACQSAFTHYSLTAHIGMAEPVRFLWHAQDEPLAVASADMDEDGFPDLVKGYAGPYGNVLIVRSGSSNDPYSTSSFSPGARTFAAPETPNFIGAGDFDADGHFDLVIAAIGSDALYLLPGDGRGEIGAARRIGLPGRLTTLLAGEVNRIDGLTDVMLGVVSGDGPKLMIFEGPEGALMAQPEIFALPSEATALALGQVDGDYPMDLSVTTGSETVIVHGRDRKLSLDPTFSSEVPPAALEYIPLLKKNAYVESAVLTEGPAAATITLTVTNINDSGPGSLRQALLDANANPGPDIILFNIGGGGPQTITPVRFSPLPPITDPVTIDATTQPGFAGTPIIELNGVLTTTGNGLWIVTRNCLVRGLVINRFREAAVRITDGTSNVIEGNYLGTDINGVSPLANGSGFILENSTNNRIGGTTPSARNVISGNLSPGVNIAGGSGNLVQGNYIGTNAAGTTAIGSVSGVSIRFSATNNIIGGTTAGAGNVISGNGTIGISNSAFGNLVQGNFIGINAAGDAAFGNDGNAVVVSDATGNTIGGTTPGARNVISGNKLDGILIFAASSTLVQGNYIGTNAAGTATLGNRSGVVIQTLSVATSHTIGGATAGAGNLISGNKAHGVAIANSVAPGISVQGNFIGTDASGAAPLGNFYSGVSLGFSTGCRIESNTIAFNNDSGLFAGVSITSSVGTGTGNAIRSNSIFSNNGLGIDLVSFPSGVTPNDPVDADTGANNLQNFPVLAMASSGSGNTNIQGSLNSAAKTTFTLDFFSSPSCDPSGNGEGQTFLGSTTVVTDSSGNASFTANLQSSVLPGQVVTATATDPNNNTSEFSSCKQVVSANRAPLVTDPGNQTNAEGDAVSLQIVASDPDGDTVSYSASGLPPGLAINAATGLISGTLGFSASATYTVMLSVADGNGGTASESFTWTITNTNRLPIITNPGNQTNLEGATVSLQIVASDPDVDALTYAATGLPPGLTINATTGLITGGLDFTTAGSYPVTLSSSDPNGGDAQVSFMWTVINVNRSPDAVDDAANAQEDSAVNINALSNDSDPDSDALTIVSFTQGSSGAVAHNADGSFTYTPNPNFNGTDSFTYTASDGNGGFDTAHVSVSVTPVNDAPIAAGDTATSNEDAAVIVNLLANDSDPDGESFTVTGVTQGANGSVANNSDGTITYTPNTNFNGSDTFSYTISDGHGGTSTAIVNITVTPVNDAPAARNDNYVTDEDTALSVSARGVLGNDEDVDMDQLSSVLVSGTSHGLLTLGPDGSFTYTPNANFNGTDYFTYKVNDGSVNSNTATVNILVNAINDAPVAMDDSTLTLEDTAAGITLIASDVDSSSLNFSIVDAPLHGTLDVVGGNAVNYTPNPTYYGPDSFTFRANDGQADSNLATVSIMVSAVPDAPVLATVGDKTVAEGALLAFGLTASDPDGDTLTFSATDLPAGATLDVATGAFSWTPTFAQAGSYRVTFTVTDPSGLSASETVTLTVVDVIVNQGPACWAARPSLAEIWPPNHKETRIIEILGLTDPDNDPLTVTILRILQDEPTNTLGDGTTWIDGGGIGAPQAWVRAERSGTPRVPGNGRVYELFFEASDGKGNSCTGSVKVGVPHDQGNGRPAVDDGKRFDSTVAGGPCLNCNN